VDRTNRLICGVFCLAIGLASAQTTQLYRQTGNLVGATAIVSGSSYQANVNISPAVLPGNNNQELYWVYWSTTIFGGAVPPPVCILPTDPPPPPADMASIGAGGFVSAAAIRRLPSGALSVDLDLNKMQHPTIWSQQCVSGICSQLPPPATFPLRGTFTPVLSGPGANSSSSSGNRSTVNTDAICRFENSYSGNQSDTTARFAGQLGNITVPTTLVGTNAQLHVQKGQWTNTSTCIPPTAP
jgi:hypothetical protein